MDKVRPANAALVEEICRSGRRPQRKQQAETMVNACCRLSSATRPCRGVTSGDALPQGEIVAGFPQDERRSTVDTVWLRRDGQPAWAQLRVGDCRRRQHAFPITVARSSATSQESDQPIAAIIRADLERSGLFTDRAPNFPLAETSTPLGPTGAGAASVGGGLHHPPGDGRFDVRCSGTRSIAFGPDWRIPPWSPGTRLAAHRIADSSSRRSPASAASLRPAWPM